MRVSNLAIRPYGTPQSLNFDKHIDFLYHNDHNRIICQTLTPFINITTPFEILSWKSEVSREILYMELCNC